MPEDSEKELNNLEKAFKDSETKVDNLRGETAAELKKFDAVLRRVDSLKDKCISLEDINCEINDYSWGYERVAYYDDTYVVLRDFDKVLVGVKVKGRSFIKLQPIIPILEYDWLDMEREHITILEFDYSRSDDIVVLYSNLVEELKIRLDRKTQENEVAAAFGSLKGLI